MQQIGLNLHLYVRKPEELRQNSWDEALDWDKMDNLAKYWSEIMFQQMCLPAVKKPGYDMEDAWGASLLLSRTFAWLCIVILHEQSCASMRLCIPGGQPQTLLIVAYDACSSGEQSRVR